MPKVKAANILFETQPMTTLLDRFLRYVQIDTQANDDSDTYPSTPGQLDLSQLLADECKALGLADVSMSEFGIVIATIPATVDHEAPAIAWTAHVDTSPEYSGKNVKPVVHNNYDGNDIVLPGDNDKVVRVEQNPELKDLVGATIVTTDGTTLLGSDDKSGIAIIMTAAAYLMEHPEIPHGPIRLCFTCDEEIGRGIDKLDVNDLNSVCCYTLDSGGRGIIDVETFSADLATVTVQGINTHPSEGKGVMVNALRILSRIIAELPVDRLSPESTDGRDGFLHPYHVEGGVAKAEARIIVRDFDTPKLAEHASLLRETADCVVADFPGSQVDVKITKQYRNMGDGLAKEPRAVALAHEATKAAGMEPVQSIIRGGTDGSLMTEAGLPTPNLSSGQHNPHSPLEWTSVEEMQSCVDVLVELAKCWGREKV